MVDVGGVALEIAVSLATSSALPPSGRVTLFTRLSVGEGVLKLLGFAEEKERRFFDLLTSVQGVGPMTAVRILSNAGIAEIAVAIRSQDEAALKRVKGVGEKLARRLVADLRDALEGEDWAKPAATGAAADAVSALTALGYTRSAAEALVEKARQALGGQPTAEALVKRAVRLG